MDFVSFFAGIFAPLVFVSFDFFSSFGFFASLAFLVETGFLTSFSFGFCTLVSFTVSFFLLFWTSLSFFWGVAFSSFSSKSIFSSFGSFVSGFSVVTSASTLVSVFASSFGLIISDWTLAETSGLESLNQLQMCLLKSIAVLMTYLPN